MDSLDHILLVRENIDELWLASHEDLKECQEFTQLYRTQIKNDVKNIFSTIVLYQKYFFFFNKESENTVDAQGILTEYVVK